jgi:hypothetical protein
LPPAGLIASDWTASSNSNTDGTYSFAAGVAPTQSFPTAVWSFEWSINSNFDGSAAGRSLDGLTYRLGIDTNPGLATTFSTLVTGPNEFDVINAPVCADHSTGNNSTGNGSGAEVNCGTGTAAADYANAIATDNVAQNSWKPHWFISGFDPTVDGQYDFYLAAFDGQTQLARTDISIIVGTGAASVPGPATLGLLALGVAGLGWSRRMRNS